MLYWWRRSVKYRGSLSELLLREETQLSFLDARGTVTLKNSIEQFVGESVVNISWIVKQ
jgi:hypothetical protein